MKRIYLKRIATLVLVLGTVALSSTVGALKTGYDEGHYQGKQWIVHTEGDKVTCNTSFSYQGGGAVACNMSVVIDDFHSETNYTTDKYVTGQGGNCKVAYSANKGNELLVSFNATYYIKGGAVASAGLIFD